MDKKVIEGFGWYLPSPPLITAEAVMKEINGRRITHKTRIETARTALNKCLDKAKEDVAAIEKSLHDEDACFDLQNTANSIVHTLCVVLVNIQLHLSYALSDAIGDSPRADNKVWITIPVDPRCPVQVTGLPRDLKVFALAVDIRGRKREALIQDDIPQAEGKEARISCELNYDQNSK